MCPHISGTNCKYRLYVVKNIVWQKFRLFISRVAWMYHSGQRHTREEGGRDNKGSLPWTIWQFPIKRGASRNRCLVLLEDLLTLQAVGTLSGRASGQRRSGSCGHPMPGGVSPEGRLVLTGCTLAVDLVLHHWDSVKLGAAPGREDWEGKKKVKVHLWVSWKVVITTASQTSSQLLTWSKYVVHFLKSTTKKAVN